MIKFFRKIRQKLLTENKFSKYLIYAIGEIILVVIGILIALSINNWNEERKLVQKERKLLREILANLKTNENELIENINTEKRHARAIEKVFALTHNFHPTDSLDTYFSMVVYRESLSISSSSYDNLKTIGLDIVKNDALKLRLTHLFDVSYAQQIKNIDMVGVSLFNKIADFIFANPFYFEGFRLGKFTDLETTRKYQLLLIAKQKWKDDVIQSNKAILEETTDMITEIQEYLGND